jgi:hypothetical protein
MNGTCMPEPVESFAENAKLCSYGNTAIAYKETTCGRNKCSRA